MRVQETPKENIIGNITSYLYLYSMICTKHFTMDAESDKREDH